MNNINRIGMRKKQFLKPIKLDVKICTIRLIRKYERTSFINWLRDDTGEQWT